MTRRRPGISASSLDSGLAMFVPAAGMAEHVTREDQTDTAGGKPLVERDERSVAVPSKPDATPMYPRG